MCYLCLALVLVSTILEIRWLSAAGLGVLALGLLQALIFYKCPHCKKRFKLGSRRPSVCPYCGAKLEDTEPEKPAETKQVEAPAEAAEEKDE